jgi:hypothetical protein
MRRRRRRHLVGSGSPRVAASAFGPGRKRELCHNTIGASHDNQRLVLECLTTNLARYDSICRLNKGSCMRQHLHRMDQSLGPACSSILLVCCMHLPELKRRPSMPGIRKPESMHPAGRKLTWFPRLAITMCHTLDDENAHKID